MRRSQSAPIMPLRSDDTAASRSHIYPATWSQTLALFVSTWLWSYTEKIRFSFDVYQSAKWRPLWLSLCHCCIPAPVNADNLESHRRVVVWRWHSDCAWSTPLPSSEASELRMNEPTTFEIRARLTVFRTQRQSLACLCLCTYTHDVIDVWRSDVN